MCSVGACRRASMPPWSSAWKSAAWHAFRSAMFCLMQRAWSLRLRCGCCASRWQRIPPVHFSPKCFARLRCLPTATLQPQSRSPQSTSTRPRSFGMSAMLCCTFAVLCCCCAVARMAHLHQPLSCLCACFFSSSSSSSSSFSSSFSSFSSRCRHLGRTAGVPDAVVLKLALKQTIEQLHSALVRNCTWCGCLSVVCVCV